MKKPHPSKAAEEAVFRNAVYFVVRIYQDHWDCVHSEEVKTAKEAFELIKNHDQRRILLYAVSAQGRFSVFGASELEHLKTLGGENDMAVHR